MNIICITQREGPHPIRCQRYQRLTSTFAHLQQAIKRLLRRQQNPTPPQTHITNLPPDIFLYIEHTIYNTIPWNQC